MYQDLELCISVQVLGNLTLWYVDPKFQIDHLSIKKQTSSDFYKQNNTKSNTIYC